MNRRTLVTAAGTALVTPVTGCLSGDWPGSESGTNDPSGDGPPGSNATDANSSVGRSTERNATDERPTDGNCPDETSTYPVDEFDGGWVSYEPAGEHRSFDVGSRAGVDDAYGPHGVRVWNAAGDPEITVTITDALDDSVVHDETHEIPADREISITLLAPSSYHLEVAASAADSAHRLRVPCWSFDCNSSSTRIAVRGDGRIESSFLTTTAACPHYGQ